MDLAFQDIWRQPLFRIGLAVKAVLVLLVAPEVQTTWFVPFIQAWISSPTWDPWTTFLNANGDPLAFPYGIVMFLAHLPGVLVGTALDRAFSLDLFAGIGFRLSLLAADLTILLVLARLYSEHLRAVLAYFWLSPIALYVTYWHGQTDFVPVALMMVSLALIKRERAHAAGAAIGLAIAAKLSMLLAAPFLLLYVWNNKRLRDLLVPFASGAALALLVTQAPYLLSSGFQTMTFGSPEIAKVYQLAAHLGDDIQLYLTPLVYLLTLYATWRLRRINFDLLVAILGVAFFVVVLLTPASVGWYLWIIPFLAVHQQQSGRPAAILTGFFALLLIPYHILFSQGAAIPLFGLDLAVQASYVDALASPHPRSLWLTLLTATGAVLAIQMFRRGIASNDFYRLGRRPLGIGIGGDSGSGKSTLSLALAGIFGEPSVVHLSGDDYHLWERHAPMWKALTHLNPRANDLMRFTNDVLGMLEGGSVVGRRYDHASGRFSLPEQLSANDVVIVAGLHALYPPELVERLDVRIFVDADEGLRRHWKLSRDTERRQQDAAAVIEAMETRRPDSERYIQPQARNADIVFALSPSNPELLDREAQPSEGQLRLTVTLRRGLYYEHLVRTLIGVCGLHLDVDLLEDGTMVELSVDGEVTAEDVQLAAGIMVPHLDELIDRTPGWQGHMIGIMQLISLVQIDQALRMRTWR